MQAELHCLDGTVVKIERDLSGSLDGIEIGTTGLISAPGRGRIPTVVESLTDTLIVFRELEPEVEHRDPFEPGQIPIVAHTFHVGAYARPDRPDDYPPEVVHVMGFCDLNATNEEPLKIAAMIPLENRAMCDRMIEEITRARDEVFPAVHPDCTCNTHGPVNPCPIHVVS